MASKQEWIVSRWWAYQHLDARRTKERVKKRYIHEIVKFKDNAKRNELLGYLYNRPVSEKLRAIAEIIWKYCEEEDGKWLKQEMEKECERMRKESRR